LESSTLRRSAVTNKSIPLQECVVLAHRVSDGDCSFVNWVRIDPDDKHGRYFDNLHALARSLVREMEAAGHVVREPSGEYGLAYPNDGRFQSLKKKLESEWLPQAQELSLVEYVEKLFVKERGVIRREEIERIGLALVDAAHDASGSNAARIGCLGQRLKGKAGRKPKFTPAQLETLRSMAISLLEDFGDPESDNPHSEFRSKEDMIRMLQQNAVMKPIDFPEEPPRTTLQPLVNKWLEEWRTIQTSDAKAGAVAEAPVA
jgi:hypothetical protein